MMASDAEVGMFRTLDEGIGGDDSCRWAEGQCQGDDLVRRPVYFLVYGNLEYIFDFVVAVGHGGW